MSLSAIVSSDWHLMGMSKVFRNPLQYQLPEISKPYKHAIEHGIKHVMVPGDMSDVPRLDDYHLIALITFLLSYDGHIHTHYQLGNHDVAHTTKTSMDVLKVLADSGFFKTFNLYMKPTVKKIEGVYCAFMPFPHNEVPECPKPPMVFAHIEVKGAIGDNGRPLMHGNDDQFVRRPGDYVISGHIHQHQILKSKRFAYCGSLYQKNFGEALPKGFIEFKAKYKEDRLIVIPEFISSKPEFTLETKIITCSDDWDTLVKEENVRYKILTEEGVIAPKNILRDFPNIVYLQSTGRGRKVDMEGVEDGTNKEMVKSIQSTSITTGLKRYLKSSDLNPAQVDRARKLVAEARRSIGV